jgi:hypothetical protein
LKSELLALDCSVNYHVVVGAKCGVRWEYRKDDKIGNHQKKKENQN